VREHIEFLFLTHQHPEREALLFRDHEVTHAHVQIKLGFLARIQGLFLWRSCCLLSLFFLCTLLAVFFAIFILFFLPLISVFED